MPSLKVDGNELVNIDIPDQFPGKVFREYTLQTDDGSNSENHTVSITKFLTEPENFKKSRQKTREIKKNFFREIAFLADLNFFPV